MTCFFHIKNLLTYSRRPCVSGPSDVIFFFSALEYFLLKRLPARAVLINAYLAFNV